MNDYMTVISTKKTQKHEFSKNLKNTTIQKNTYKKIVPTTICHTHSNKRVKLLCGRINPGNITYVEAFPLCSGEYHI